MRKEAFVGDSPTWDLHWRPLVHCCGLDGTLDYDFMGRFVSSPSLVVVKAV